jgi:hypothetical protein
MKQYAIDELRPEDQGKLKAYLDEHLVQTGIEGVYHVHLPEAGLTDLQLSHPDCRPFYLALELEPERLVCELLVRTDSRVRCDCMGYATEAQRNWAIAAIDAICEKLSLIT